MKAYHVGMSDEEFDDLVIESVLIEFAPNTLPTTGGMMLHNIRMGDLSKCVLEAIRSSEAMGV